MQQHDSTVRKYTSMLLALVMVLGMMPGVAFAAPEDTYTVTFADGSGGVITTQIVPSGGFATTPTPDPTRPGHTFAGWERWPSTAIGSLREGWVDPISYWTSLPTTWSIGPDPILMDGAAQTVGTDASVTFSIETTAGYADSGMRWWIGRLGDLPDFVLPGEGDPYFVNMKFDNGDPGQFNGISAASHFTEEQILAGTALHSNCNFGPLTIDGDTIFGVYNSIYGPWTLDQFRAGEFTATGEFSAITPDTLVRLNVGISTMTGAATSATVSAPEAVPFSFDTTPIYADTTFTATWTIDTHTVTFEDGFGGVITTQNVPFGGFATTPTPDPTRTGYTFLGWAGGSTEAYESLLSGWANPISYWTSLPTTWSIGPDPILMDGAAQTVGTDASVTFSIETTTGYADSGMRWWIGRLGDLPDFVLPGTGSPFFVNARFDNGDVGLFNGLSLASHLAPGDEHTNYDYGPLTIDGDTIFASYNGDLPYRTWTLADIRAGGFSATGGYSAITADTLVRLNVGISTMTGAATSATVSAPQRTPFAFDTYRIYSDTTITALWSIDSYTVTFRGHDGTVLKTQTVEYNTAATAPVAPVRTGYTFTGWDAVFSNVTGDLTVTAQYAKSAVNVIRLPGLDRYDTAALAAVHDFPSGADTAIVAFGGDFPDALSASGLAGAANAPILLTGTSTLNAATGDAITSLGITKVYIVGGTGVVGTSVEAALSELDGVTEVKRLGGLTRYDTSKLIAQETVAIGGSTTAAFVVRGDLFADALAVSSVATQMKMPVLLTQPSALTAQASAFITTQGIDNVYVAGGTGAVSASVVAALADLAVTERWFGATRYSTAADVIRNSVTTFGVSVHYVGIASGENFPDALVGGAALGARGGVLLLTTPTALSPETLSILTMFKSQIIEAQIMGGTGALSSDVEASVQAALQ